MKSSERPETRNPSASELQLEKEKLIEEQIVTFKENFCPYGIWDIRAAVIDALDAGMDADWAFDQIEEFCTSCDAKITEVDPCYIVKDAILQIARNEIDEITSFDIQNDANFYTFGNFLASTYDYGRDDIDALIKVLRDHPGHELSEATRCWLNEVEIDYDKL